MLLVLELGLLDTYFLCDLCVPEHALARGVSAPGCCVVVWNKRPRWCKSNQDTCFRAT